MVNKISIKQLFDYDTCTYSYILWDYSSKDAVIIDPVLEQINRDLDLIKKLELNLLYIFETHVHADHITGASKLREKTKAKICYGSKTGVKGADLLLDHNATIEFGSFKIKVLHTPGHTSGCVCYFIDGYIITTI